MGTTRLTMENVKKRVAALGGDGMSDFLYFQVFYCLHLDDSKPMLSGSALFAAYQRGYQDLNSVYNDFWAETKYGAPPRSCFALSWIPGNSLIEVVGAAYIESSATKPAQRPLLLPRDALLSTRPARMATAQIAETYHVTERLVLSFAMTGR